MFGKLFGSKSAAQHSDDQVWMTGAARVQGMCRVVATLAGQGRSVIVVALTVSACDAMTEALSAHQPAQCRDLFGREALRAQMARQGAVTVALASALPVEISVADKVDVDILVVARNASRAADDAIVRFADVLGARANIAFHLALDDELLQKFGGNLKPLLDNLGLREDEPIASPLITRAVENCQKKS